MKSVLLSAVCLFFCAGSVSAQVLSDTSSVKEIEGSYLQQLQKRDSVLIADQLVYGFELDGVEAGTEFSLPDYSGGFCDGVTVVSPWRVDTLRISRKTGTLDIRGGIVITSFDKGEYELPSIVLGRRLPDGNTDSLRFDPQTLSVMEMPVDTATFELHDIKGQVRYPLTFSEILPYILGFQLLASLAILAVCLVKTYRKRRNDDAFSREPAHIRALRKLDKYRGDKMWTAEKQKQFYSGVTDALREYMVFRFGVSAMEMTTNEIFGSLTDKDIPENLYSEVKSLFERADYVKFAKYIASEEENAAAVPLAVRFVTETYQAELDEEAKKQSEETETEVKQKEG